MSTFTKQRNALEVELKAARQRRDEGIGALPRFKLLKRHSPFRSRVVIRSQFRKASTTTFQQWLAMMPENIRDGTCSEDFADEMLQACDDYMGEKVAEKEAAERAEAKRLAAEVAALRIQLKKIIEATTGSPDANAEHELGLRFKMLGLAAEHEKLVEFQAKRLGLVKDIVVPMYRQPTE